MRVILIICSTVLMLSCNSHSQDAQKELAALKEIVLLRTEGILLLEKARAVSMNKDLKISYLRIKGFYADSQMNLLELCSNKSLDLSMDYYNEINNRIEVTLSDSIEDRTLMKNIILNFEEQKKAYLTILSDRKLTSLHIFALNCFKNVQYLMNDITTVPYYKNLWYI